jgi:flagellar basal-body rod protein FlgG
MNAQQLNVDTIANNLANASTTGYKMRKTQFQDLMYESMIQPGSAAGTQTLYPTGLQVGLGVRPASNEIVFTQGNATETDNPLDLVIQGKGFFQVKQPDGTLAYTRDGSLHLDANGNIVSSVGDALQPQITIPPQGQSITIAPDGTVSYTLPNQIAAQTAGQIQLANFQNPAGLNSLGGNLYVPTDASGQPNVGTPAGPEGLGALMQGYQEESNVSVVQEFINLIQSQRAYEADSKVVKAADEMYQQINTVKQ